MKNPLISKHHHFLVAIRYFRDLIVVRIMINKSAKIWFKVKDKVPGTVKYKTSLPA